MRLLAHALVLAAAMLLVPACALAASFQYMDRELACDNTRTCRAVGYQRIEDDKAVSVLLTRAAGQGEGVLGKVTLGHHDEHPSMRDEGTGKLAAAQLAARWRVVASDPGVGRAAGQDKVMRYRE